jgi:coproporphyrinogen III oxidase-like Fe-S oxidoreductase
MGVQSLNNKALKEVGRESSAEIYRALSVLDKGVVSNVSIDFILGLPFVKPMELQNAIQHIRDNHHIIKHFSVYMLEDYYEIPEEPDSKFQHVKYPVNWSKNGLCEEEYLSEYLSCRKFLKKS